MVVFACSACGESLKKNQVENHYLRKCRNCNVLSCLDCGKDFWGKEYEQHTKCISEEEKYSGKNFVAKPGSNKNEKKQQQWLNQVQEAVDKCRTNPRLKAILIRLKDQPNVPRKKNKFLNFLANGFYVKDPNLASQVWDVLMANTEINKQESKQSQASSVQNDSTEVKQTDDNANNTSDNKHATDNTEAEPKKLSKRAKREERRKKLHKTEKKDKDISLETDKNVQENGVSEKVSKKRSKKKGIEDMKPTKKRNRAEKEYEEEVADDVEDQPVSEEDETNEPARKKFKTKFDWNEIIIEVLQTKGPELKIKKLRKKVLGEYLSQGCTEKSEEKLWARFEKKLKRIPEVKVIGEKAKLKHAS